MKDNRQVPCPYCGEQIRSDAKSCPHCGSDENTGWSEKTYLDGIELPDESEYDQILKKEFGHERGGKAAGINWKMIIGALVLIVLLMLVVLGV